MSPSTLVLLLLSCVCQYLCADSKPFSSWDFTHSNSSLLSTLPIDKDTRNYRRTVLDSVFSVTQPTPFQSNPVLALLSDDALIDLLDLHPEDCRDDERFIGFVAGCWLHPSALHLTHRYGGHQFGYWADQLGDGRAILLGEYTSAKGERWELQLKGSGRTPYSRSGDGRAVLRSSVREFLASEAMFHLGVPTSRAASLVVSEDLVWRDPLYDGRPRQEKAAVVLRLALSWFRIGSLEILSRNGEVGLLRKVADFVIVNFFPHLRLGPDAYLEFFCAVVNQTAHLISTWQSLGFAHGVCNTDNFSLLSITIDYGPFGFMGAYDRNYVPNSSDDEGRYRFSNQPSVGLFNLEKLLESLALLLSAEQYLYARNYLDSSYMDVYNRHYFALMGKKLGLAEADRRVVNSLLDLMEGTGADYTTTFRELSEVTTVQLEAGPMPQQFWSLPRLMRAPGWHSWISTYRTRILYNCAIHSYCEGQRLEKLQQTNPRYVLRNYMAEDAIRLAEAGNFSELQTLHEILKKPFKSQPAAEERGYASRPPPWSLKLQVSCSS